VKSFPGRRGKKGKASTSVRAASSKARIAGRANSQMAPTAGRTKLRNGLRRTGKTGPANTNREDFGSSFDERAWEALAARAGYHFATFRRLSRQSPRQLQRVFSRHLGFGPEKWLRRFKLRLASERLRRGDNIKAIVAELKFSSAPYFCREFKKQYGASPKHFHSGLTNIGHRDTESQR
jgi:AraC-like DNA-binding protein